MYVLLFKEYSFIDANLPRTKPRRNPLPRRPRLRVRSALALSPRRSPALKLRQRTPKRSPRLKRPLPRPRSVLVLSLRRKPSLTLKKRLLKRRPRPRRLLLRLRSVLKLEPKTTLMKLKKRPRLRSLARTVLPPSKHLSRMKSLMLLLSKRIRSQPPPRANVAKLLLLLPLRSPLLLVPPGADPRQRRSKPPLLTMRVKLSLSRPRSRSGHTRRESLPEELVLSLN